MAASGLFEDWDPVDLLSLAQAASLWEGLAPTGNQVTPSSRAYPRFRRLKNEVYTRGLVRGGFPKGYTLISRAILRTIAAAWGETPAFLYPETRTAGHPTSRGENQCQKWLEGLMAGDSRPDKPKNQYFAHAQAQFNVSRRGFDRAWGNAISTTGNANWKKSGPKKRRNS
jgi:hypothetical protein